MFFWPGVLFAMTDKILKNISWLILIGIFLLAAVFIFIVKDLGGDIDNVLWRFVVTKVHLSQQLAMPYLTPTRCGGFHLAADAQDLIFTLYTPIAWIVPNVIWAVKLTNVLLTVLLIVGMARLLKLLGITHRLSRYSAAVIVGLSGYWVYHMTQGGNIWAHGLAFTPWVLLEIEWLLTRHFKFDRRHLVHMWALAMWLMLLINSGYYWLQVGFIIIAARACVEIGLIVVHGFSRWQRWLAVIAAGGVAIILSLPRLVGIWYFQLSKFPRMGGEVSHMQVIAGKQWSQLFVGSFIDQGIIAEARHSEYLGYYWDYSNFIGVVALVIILVGLSHIKDIIHKPFIWALAIACWFQVSITQNAQVADHLRAVIPLFKQITWYWRGYAIWLFAAAILIALGFSRLWQSRHQWGVILACVILSASVIELTLTHRLMINPRQVLHGGTILDKSPAPEVPLTKEFASCYLGYIYGYGNETPSQLSAAIAPGSLLGSHPEHPDFYNMHDVRVLSCDQANKGYYLTHQWPLWPKADKVDFDRFVHFQQVVPLPQPLQWFNYFSLVIWIGMLVMGCFLLRNSSQSSRRA